MVARLALLWTLAAGAAVAAPTVEGPPTAGIGSEVTVNVAGNSNPRDFVTIVAKDSREGAYGGYQYVAKPGAYKLKAPAEPGEYEIRLLAADSPYPTLAGVPIRIDDVKATLEGPATVEAGRKFQVKWSGPNNARDYIAIGSSSRPYITYAYTSAGNPVSLVAPDEAGDYELRYFLAEGDTQISARPISIGGVTATISGPPTVAAGGKFKLAWTGPNNPRDFVTIVKAGTAAKQYGPYAYTSKGGTLEMTAPESAGQYELRYLTAQSYATLASTPIEVTAVSATVKGPAEAVAGSSFAVKWTGPANAQDYLTIVPVGAKEGVSGNYRYTNQGNPAQLLAPLTPGAYELRYATGQSNATLANAPIQITPGKLEPGFVAVSIAPGATTGNAVEIILDASGSMLQKIGGQRRIDIAKQMLTRLTAERIPAGTPFAMRVFGREVDSCQTDLDIPLGPLDAAAVGAKIAKLQARNNAKTPIGDSLDKVAEDLRTARGERLVILLTDGEETCGGDPAAAIAKLRKAGVGVRVSIVGFAIDDESLAATFRRWSDAGGGLYFDARDAAGLDKALALALQPAIELVDSKGQVVAQGLPGAPLKAMPGSYTVRLKSQPGKGKPVTVQARETTSVSL